MLKIAIRVQTVAFWLTCVIGGAVQAQETSFDEQWRRCTADEDCVHIAYACAQGAVNRRYARQADAYFAQENAKSNCVTPPERKEESKEPYRVVCEARQCEVRGKKPRPSKFS